MSNFNTDIIKRTKHLNKQQIKDCFSDVLQVIPKDIIIPKKRWFNVKNVKEYTDSHAARLAMHAARHSVKTNKQVSFVFNVIAHKLDESDTSPPFYAGKMLFDDGQYAEAIPFLRHVFDKQPFNAHVRDILEKAYMKEGNALDSFEIRAIVNDLKNSRGSYRHS